MSIVKALSRKPLFSPLVFFLILLFALAFLVRTVGLFNMNALFLFDSARDLLWVNKIIVEHKPILIGPASGGLQGYFHGVLWYYLLSVPLFLSGGHPISGPFFMAIGSTMSVIGAYFVLKKSMNVFAGLLGVVILGFSGYSVATAQFIWNPYPIVWLMPLYFLGIYLMIHKKSRGFLLISFIQGLLIHFEVIYGLGTMPAYLFFLWFFFFKTRDSNRLKNSIIGVFLLVIPFFPSVVFDVRHDFLISKSVMNTITTGGATISHREGEKPSTFSERIYARSSQLLAYTIQSPTKNTGINVGLFLLFLLSIHTMYKKRDRQQITVILFSSTVFLSTYLIFLLLKYNVWAYYWIGNSPLYAMILSFGIGYYILEKKQQILFGVVMIVLFLALKPWQELLFWQNGTLKPGPQVLATQLQVVDTIYKDAKGEAFSVYNQTPPVYDYVYRYLFSWQGQKRGYTPPLEKQKIVYVILDGVPEDIQGEYFKKNTLRLTGMPEKSFTTGSEFPRIEKFIIDPTKEEAVDPNFFPQL